MSWRGARLLTTDHPVRFSVSFGTDHPPSANRRGSSPVRSPDRFSANNQPFFQENERFASPKPSGYPKWTRTESRSPWRPVRGANRYTESERERERVGVVAATPPDRVVCRIARSGSRARAADGGSSRQRARRRELGGWEAWGAGGYRVDAALRSDTTRRFPGGRALAPYGHLIRTRKFSRDLPSFLPHSERAQEFASPAARGPSNRLAAAPRSGKGRRRRSNSRRGPNLRSA